MAAQPMATHTITDQKMCLNPEMSNTIDVNPEIPNTTYMIIYNNTTGVKHDRRFGINIAKGTTDPRH